MSPPSWRRRLIIGLVSALVLIIATPGSASAHAVLVGSDPADGARLEQPPSRVELHFDQPVRIVPGGTQVTTAAGDRVPSSPARAADGGRAVVIEIGHGTADGPQTYIVSWRLVSTDSHPITGSIRYGVGQDPGSPVDNAPTAAADGPAVLAGLGSALVYLGLIAAIGTLLAGLLSWPSSTASLRLRPVIIGGSAMIIFGSALELESATQLSGGIRPALSLDGTGLPQPWLLVARMFLGVALLPGSWLLLRSVHRRSKLILVCWSLIAAATVITVAAHGHAAAAAQPVAAVLAGVVHLTGMASWAGGLLMLLIIVGPRLSRMPRTRQVAIRTWSRVAYLSLAALILSGEVLGWRMVQPIDALWHTPYGRVLMIKTGLVVLLMAAGLLARRLARTAAAADFRRILIIELIIMFLIIGAATVLGRTPPAVDSYGPETTLTTRVADDQVRVVVDPTRHGPQQITITVVDPAGAPVRLTSLAGSLTAVDQQISRLPVHFERAGDSWRSTDAQAPVAGRWRLQLTAATQQGRSYVTTVDYRVW